MITMATKHVVTDPISTDLKQVMRQLKLGRMLDTLPERLTLAHQQHLSPDFYHFGCLGLTIGL